MIFLNNLTELSKVWPNAMLLEVAQGLDVGGLIADASDQLSELPMNAC